MSKSRVLLILLLGCVKYLGNTKKYLVFLITTFSQTASVVFEFLYALCISEGSKELSLCNVAAVKRLVRSVLFGLLDSDTVFESRIPLNLELGGVWNAFPAFFLNRLNRIEFAVFELFFRLHRAGFEPIPIDRQSCTFPLDCCTRLRVTVEIKSNESRLIQGKTRQFRKKSMYLNYNLHWF